jgi:hypothetical protein
MRSGRSEKKQEEMINVLRNVQIILIYFACFVYPLVTHKQRENHSN